MSSSSFKINFNTKIQKEVVCIDLSDDEPVRVKTEPGLEKKVDAPPALVEEAIKPDEAEDQETPEIVPEQKSNDNMLVAPIPTVAQAPDQNAPVIKKRIIPTVVQDPSKIAALKRKMDPNFTEEQPKKLSSGQAKAAERLNDLVKRIESSSGQSSPTQSERKEDEMDLDANPQPVEVPKVPESPVDVPVPSEMQLDAAPQETPVQTIEKMFGFWVGSEAKTLRGNLLWCAIAPSYDPNVPPMEGNQIFGAASDLVTLINKHYHLVCDYTRGLVHFLDQGKELEAMMFTVRLMILQAFGEYPKLQNVDPCDWPCLSALNQIGIQSEDYGMPESVAWVVVSLFATKFNLVALKNKIAEWYAESQTPFARLDYLAFSVIMICRKIDATEKFDGGDFSSLKKEGEPFFNPYKNKSGTESSKLRGFYGWKKIDEIAKCIYLDRIEGKNVSEIKKPEEAGEKQEKKQKKEKSNKSEKKDGKKKKDEQSNDNNQEKPKKKQKAADMKFTLNEVAKPVQKAKEDKPPKPEEPELPIVQLEDDPSINEKTLVLLAGKGKHFWFLPNQTRVFLGPWGSSDDSGLKNFLRRLKMIKTLGAQNIAQPDGKLYRAPASGFYVCYDGILDFPLKNRSEAIDVGGQPRKGVIAQSGLEHLGHIEGTVDDDELLKILSPLVFDLCCAHIAKSRTFLGNVWSFNGKTRIVLSDAATKNPRKTTDADGTAKSAPIKLTSRLLAFSKKHSPLETRLYQAILGENDNNVLIGNIKALTDTINDDPKFLETLPTGSKGILKKEFFDRAGELYLEIGETSQETLEKYEREQAAFQKKKGRKSVSLGAEDSDYMSEPDDYANDGFVV